MTDKSMSRSQDQTNPDEDLLQGLQRLGPADYCAAELSKASETEGSLLLDSINMYIHSPHPVSPIHETTEEEPDPAPPLEMPSLLVPVPPLAPVLALSEDDRPGEEVSNYSIDSSKLAVLLPNELLTSEICSKTERIDESEGQYQYSPIGQHGNNKVMECMQVDQIYQKEEEVPMEIQHEYIKPEPILMDIETFSSKPSQLLMDIESIGFPICNSLNPQDLNQIALDPIHTEPMHILGEQEIAEEQEMLDSMSCQQNTIHIQHEPYKEFTFGKEQVQYTVYDQANENIDNIDKQINIQTGQNNQGNSDQPQNCATMERPQDQSFWNELREENIQNISMNVEHDNNFSSAARDVEEIFDTSSKNEGTEIIININEPILSTFAEPVEVIEVIEVAETAEVIEVAEVAGVAEEYQKPPSLSKSQNNHFQIQQRQAPAETELKVESKPSNHTVEIEHQAMQIEVIGNEQEQTLIKQVSTHLRNENNENILCVVNLQETHPSASEERENEDKQDCQGVLAEEYVRSIAEIPPAQQEFKRSRSKNCSIINGIWSYAFENAARSTSAIQQSGYQNTNTHMPAYSIPFTQHQDYYMNQTNPSNHQHYQPIVQAPLQPWITINYKMNEASISLFGPSTTTANHQESSNNLIKSNVVAANNQRNKSPINNHEKIIVPEDVGEEIVQPVEITCENVVQMQAQDCKQPKNAVNAPKIPEKQYVSSFIQTSEIFNNQNQKRNTIDESIKDIEKKCDFMIRECEAYLLEFDFTNERAHKQFERTISRQVLLRFTPEPKSEVGRILFKNGLFLISLVKFITRTSPTSFIFCYIYEYLENTYGHSLERNSYVFKNQCLKAKRNYQEDLEKRIDGIMASQLTRKMPEKTEKKQVIRRNCITPNLFYSIHAQMKETKQIGLQIDLEVPQKQKSSHEPNRSAFKNENKHEQKQKSAQPTKFTQSDNAEEDFSNKKSFFMSPPNQKPEPNATSIIKTSQASRFEVTKAQPKRQQATQVQKQIKIEIPKETSNNKDKSAENKIKKNIEEIKNSFGSYGKKNESSPADLANNEKTRFKQLFDKYRRISEDKGEKLKEKGDLPIDNSSIKRNLISQVVKDSEKETEPEKKALKKQVNFPETVVKLDTTENEEDSEEEVVKNKKKRRKNKSKRDVSAESSEIEDGGHYMKTRKTQSKK